MVTKMLHYAGRTTIGQELDVLEIWTGLLGSCAKKESTIHFV
jgi:hypothetical protein